MIQSTAAVKPSKAKKPAKRPAKPREDFPLFAHRCGHWAKKVRGDFKYFGRWKDDPKGEKAILKWLDERDDLLAGREPRAKGDAAGLTVKGLCDRYLAAKELQRDSGELKPATFNEYYKSCLRIAAAFGRGRLVSDLVPDDFRQLRKAIAKIRCIGSLGNEIQKIRSVFKFGYDERLIPAPVHFGTGFDKPSRKAVRIERAKKGRRDLQADQIRQIIDKATIPLKAMILLAVNCGFGNTDCGTLPLSAVDLETGWIEFSRAKTGTARKAKLWPETIAALQASIASRPEPKDKANAKLVFVTIHGAPWTKAIGADPISKMFGRVLVDLGIHRAGLGFYSLRRTFRTVADQLPDQHAISLVMGHTASASDMGSLYTQVIGDDRLEAVAAHVRQWLFPAKTEAK
jgi:integrase